MKIYNNYKILIYFKMYILKYVNKGIMNFCQFRIFKNKYSNPPITWYPYNAFSYYAISISRITRGYFCAVKFIMICKVHISFACLCTCVDLCYYKITLFYSICVLMSVGLILFL